ncbi:hypothetical protein MPH_04269 [Macrophomina phaseolina MS6]|uniref:DUF6594 domain-containing protein n=1 Tax=Macrophomina phaseolina (strain MS6) TaxID=1126212 RepID=K2S0I0_MACPH|nr:hypothetical protein MPH_04269 [Macrophomina phaseolina MS6]
MADQPVSPVPQTPRCPSCKEEMVIEIDPEYESGSAGSPRSRPEERTAAAQTQQGMYPATVLSPEDAGPLTEASRTARRDDAGSTQRTGLLPKVAAALGLGPEPELDGRFKDLKVKRLVDYPDGYPQYAAFLNTDANFRIYRRFGTLRNRVMLHRQFELAELEKRLDRLDELDDTPERRRRLSSIRFDKAQQDSERNGLIEEIDSKLEHYDALLARERDSLAMDTPTRRNHRNLVNYVWNKRKIAKSEIELLNRIDDFVILSKDQDSPFHAFLENVLHKYSFSWLQCIFVSETQKEKARGAERTRISLFSKTRINMLIQLIVALITLTLLVVPVCLLFDMDLTDEAKVVIVVVFVLVFPVSILFFATPRPHELFAATAAYTAVLVVFLSNVTGGEVPRQAESQRET